PPGLTCDQKHTPQDVLEGAACGSGRYGVRWPHSAEDQRKPMDLTDVVVCSFYTADDYYRDHAERLRKNLADIGVGSELQEIVKQPGEDWADICRKKISFLGKVCEDNPDKKVFWIDVDCMLL